MHHTRETSYSQKKSAQIALSKAKADEKKKDLVRIPILKGFKYIERSKIEKQ
jgi:hypothetical protein